MSGSNKYQKAKKIKSKEKVQKSSVSVENEEIKENENEFTKLGHKVMKNYNNYISNNKDDLMPCVLVATGTFSPVHRMHIINMELSKQHIEKTNNKYRVVGGFISPTHDTYCKCKLGALSISATHRINMLSLALEDNDWVEVSPWHPNQQCMQSIRGEIGYIEEMIKNLYPKQYKKFTIFYVCGSDLAISLNLNYGFGHYGVCIIQRESDLMLPYHIKFGVVPPMYLIDIPMQYDNVKNASSTELRHCICHGTLINHLTFDNVQQYMVENDILGGSKLKHALLQAKRSKTQLFEQKYENASNSNLSKTLNDEK